MSAEASLPRPFGDYLLVAQLGDDPLGSVYRAIHLADDKRFVRLRILQSGELSPRGVLGAVEKLEARLPALAHDGIVRRPQYGVVGGVPFMAWYETAGWTLDRVLAMARAAKAPVATEYALLLGQRLIEAMEAATRFLESDLTPHGALWPGFVSISNDAEVRIAGFGLASIILPVLRKPRVSREVAPYVAPEARDRRRALANSDVYSIGIMLLELLTGRRPALGAPLPELRAGDPFSQEIGAFLKVALAPPEERYPTISDMRRALNETMMAAPKLLYPAGLAFYLYKLLNAESTDVVPTDADSTIPVEEEPRLAGDADIESEPQVFLRVLDAPAGGEAPGAPREAEPFDLTPAEISEALGDSAEASDSQALSPASSTTDLAPAQTPPLEPHGADPALLEAARPRSPARARGTGALLVLAGTVFGLAVLIDTERSRRLSASPADAPPAAEMSANDPSPAAPPAAPPGADSAQPTAPTRPSMTGESSPTGLRAAAPTNAQRREMENARRSAKDLRLQAALARVAAQQLEGPMNAPDSFKKGKNREQEGEELFRAGQYDAARSAFEKAARLYREAETLSRAERVRRVQLSPAK
jgi:protein tyrosine kinase